MSTSESEPDTHDADASEAPGVAAKVGNSGRRIGSGENRAYHTIAADYRDGEVCERTE